MLRLVVAAIATFILATPAIAQIETVTGDRSTPLRALGGEGNVDISNATMRNQDEIRVLRVVLEPGGTRAMHAHSDVAYHLFTPISGSMTLLLDEGETLEVLPWHPYFLEGGTTHGFRNDGARRVEIMEGFVR